MAKRGRWWVVVALLLLCGWSVGYFLWPRLSLDDGPFFAEPFASGVDGLPVLSFAELKLLGTTLFVLETRATTDPDARTVFLLRDATGSLRWAGATPVELGRIRLVDRPPRWFAPGGWVVAIKPERTESGELYLSPFGQYRFAFHSW